MTTQAERERKLQATFLEEASELVAQIQPQFRALVSNPKDPKTIEKITHLVHNLKASAQAAGFYDLSSFLHQLETYLSHIIGGAAGSESTRLLLQCDQQLMQVIMDLKQDPSVEPDCSTLEEELSGQTPHSTLKPTFLKLQRIVHQLSEPLGKKVLLVFAGEEIKLPQPIPQKLADPLVHLVRNAIDHGIETPGVRLLQAKPAEGTISISLIHTGDRLTIEVSDDGAGLDPAALIKTAIAKNLLPAGASLSDPEAYALIFLPGFSTKTSITEVSGRGIGMDIVKRNVEKLKGKVEIDSKLNHGTTIKLIIPL